MDPISVILQALEAGTTPDVGVLSMIPDDIRNEYGTLTDLVAARLSAVGAEGLLEQYLAQPELFDTPLAEALEEAGANEDGELIDYAQNFMQMVDVRGAAHGAYDVELDEDIDGFV